jgi:hypothetical protein
MNTVSTWSRHYGSYDRRLCARPGCGADAAATLRFLPIQREASLVDIDVTSARTEGDLCEEHALTLTLPRGFHLSDERRVVRTVTIVRAAEPHLEAAQPEDLLDAHTPLLKRAFDKVLPLDE